MAWKDCSSVSSIFARSLKTVDLQVRPIYHWKDDRIRAHVFLCMLAYYVEWHLRGALSELLFDDHDREAAEATRASIVSPAPRSEAAKRKEQERRTADECAELSVFAEGPSHVVQAPSLLVIELERGVRARDLADDLATSGLRTVGPGADRVDRTQLFRVAKNRRITADLSRNPLREIIKLGLNKYPTWYQRPQRPTVTAENLASPGQGTIESAEEKNPRPGDKVQRPIYPSARNHPPSPTVAFAAPG